MVSRISKNNSNNPSSLPPYWPDFSELRKKRIPRWKIGLGIGGVILLVIVVLFSQQIGDLLKWIGSKAQTPAYEPIITLRLVPNPQNAVPKDIRTYTITTQIEQGTDPIDGSPVPFYGTIQFNATDLASQYPLLVESATITVPEMGYPDDDGTNPMITVMDTLTPFGLGHYINRRLSPADMGLVANPPIFTVVLKDYPLELGGIPLNFQVNATVQYKISLGTQVPHPIGWVPPVVHNPLPAYGTLNLAGPATQPDFTLEVIPEIYDSNPGTPAPDPIAWGDTVHFNIKLTANSEFSGSIILSSPGLETAKSDGYLDSYTFDENPALNMVPNEIRDIDLAIVTHAGLTINLPIIFDVTGISGLLIHTDTGEVDVAYAPSPYFEVKITVPTDKTYTVISGDPVSQYTIVVTSKNGFAGTVALSAPILTSLIGSNPLPLQSASFNDNQPFVDVGNPATIFLYVRSNSGLTDKNYITFAVNGDAGSLHDEDTGHYNIDPVIPDFTIYISDPAGLDKTKMTTRGGTVTYTITLDRKVNPQVDYTKDVILGTDIQDKIAGVASYNFDPPIFPATDLNKLTSILTVTMLNTADTVTKTFFVTGTGSMGLLLDKVVTVTGALGVWDYEVIVTPPSQQTTPGNPVATVYTVNINWLNGFNENVVLTSDLYANNPTFIAGPPNDPVFAVNPVLPGNSATFNFSVLTIGSLPATLPFKIFGESATSHLIHRQNQTVLEQNPPDLILILSLTPDFSIAVTSPPNLVPPNPAEPHKVMTVPTGTATYVITLTRLNDYRENVALSTNLTDATHFPNSIASYVFNPPVFLGNNPDLVVTATLTVTVKDGVATETKKFDIVGTGLTQTHSDAATLGIWDFKLHISPPSRLGLTPGDPTTFDITAEWFNADGVTDQINLATDLAINNPLFIGSAVFAPLIIPGNSSATSVLHVQTIGTQPSPVITFSVTGTAFPVGVGLPLGLIRSTFGTISLSLVPDFDIYISDPVSKSRDTIPGGTVTYTVTLERLHGYSQNVVLATDIMSIIPDVQSATFDLLGNTFPGSNPALLTAKLTVVVKDPATALTYVFHITGTGLVSGIPKIDTETATLNIQDFDLAIVPTTQSIHPTENTSYTINITRKNFYAEPINLSTNLWLLAPTLVNVEFVPPVISAGSSTSELQVESGLNTNTGTFNFLVTSQGALSGLTRAKSADLIISTTPDFDITITEPLDKIRMTIPGGTVTYTVTLQRINNYDKNVNLTTNILSAIPDVASAVFDNATFLGTDPADTTARLTVVVKDPVSVPATTNFTITGTGLVGGANKMDTEIATLGIQDFDISIAPLSHDIHPTENATYTITVTRKNLYAEPITLSTNLWTLHPSLTNVQFVPSIIPGGSFQAELQVETELSTSTGNINFAVTGQGNPSGISKTKSAALNISATPDFSIEVTPALQAIGPAESTTYTVKLNRFNNFNRTVDLSSNLLTAFSDYIDTATFDDAVFDFGGADETTLRITAKDIAISHDVVFTVTGVDESGSVSDKTDQATLRITVIVLTPGFSIEVTPELREVVPLGNTTYTVKLTRINNFNQTVDLSSNLLTSFSDYVDTATFDDAVFDFGGADETTLRVSAKDISASHDVVFTVTGKDASGSVSDKSDQATLRIIVQTPGGGGGGGGTPSVVPPTTGGDQDYTIAVDPLTNTTIYPGQSATYKVTVVRTGGFTGPVALTTDVLQLNSDVATAAFGKTIVPSGEDSTTLTLTAKTNAVIDSHTLFHVLGTNVDLGDRKDEDNVAIIVPPQLPSTGPAPSPWFWITVLILTLIGWQQLHLPQPRKIK